MRQLVTYSVIWAYLGLATVVTLWLMWAGRYEVAIGVLAGVPVSLDPSRGFGSDPGVHRARLSSLKSRKLVATTRAPFDVPPQRSHTAVGTRRGTLIIAPNTLLVSNAIRCVSAALLERDESFACSKTVSTPQTGPQWQGAIISLSSHGRT